LRQMRRNRARRDVAKRMCVALRHAWRSASSCAPDVLRTQSGLSAFLWTCAMQMRGSKRSRFRKLHDVRPQAVKSGTCATPKFSDFRSQATSHQASTPTPNQGGIDGTADRFCGHAVYFSAHLPKMKSSSPICCMGFRCSYGFAAVQPR